MTNPITTAFHRGTKVAQKHNARDQKVVAKEKHIDPNGEHETWLHIYSKEAFKRIFDDALKEYNAKQTDSRRVIKNYFNKINKSAQQHPCYEVILTIGDKETHPNAGKKVKHLEKNEYILTQKINELAVKKRRHRETNCGIHEKGQRGTSKGGK